MGQVGFLYVEALGPGSTREEGPGSLLQGHVTGPGSSRVRCWGEHGALARLGGVEQAGLGQGDELLAAGALWFRGAQPPGIPSGTNFSIHG